MATRRRKHAALGALLLVFACLVGPGMASAEAPRVVASILPVHSLVTGVMAGIGEPQLLIEGTVSPHTANLRPSDARALNDADVVFWVGETLETFLVRPLRNLASNASVVALASADGVLSLPGREGGAWEAHANHDHADDGDHASVEKGRGDPHIWLDPRNAQAMTVAIAAALAAVDPANAKRYADNGKAQLARLARLESDIAARLHPVHDRPYVVFHDAYQYFERRFGTAAVGSVTVSPERAPGARRVAELRQRIETLGAVCIMSEPQFQPALVASLAEATGVRHGTLDPVGVSLVPGADAYFELMTGLADKLADCLTPGG